ncbi:transposase [Chenggangzhangella methanolivorans]|uniref:Transposase n=1 Tax=Chenggangzhangella methanolivorans TaxID=1437009 RepID=A0A9E6UK87_9HYPH|nr:transposase [Chenggangzhangella methanolivorans]QZN98981.1 transposase [Chenggangzhangella methanolivorans]
MAASRLTDEEIAALLREVSNGASMEAVCAAAHVSTRTFYRWKRKFDGLTPSGVRQLKALRRENAELRRLLAERSARPAGAPSIPDAAERGATGTRLREMHGVSLGRFATVRISGG